MGRERIDDVVVVGGGIIGCAIAREAALAGLRVRLLDKGGIGGEASGAAAGILGPQIEAQRPGPLFALGLKSRDLYPEFARRVEEEAAGGGRPRPQPGGVEDRSGARRAPPAAVQARGRAVGRRIA